MTDRDDELADAIRELTQTIEELRTELEPRRRRRPLRPPTPGDLLRFADEVAVPAALAVLKANVRALETFQRGLELVRVQEDARKRTASATQRTEERASQLRRTTVSQLDTVLEELQRGVSQGSVPADERVADLLEEAKDLRDDVDQRLREAAEGAESTGSQPIQIDDPDGTSEDDHDANDDTNVDVDAELETLKDQFRSEDDPDDVPDDETADSSSNDRPTADGNDDTEEQDEGTDADDFDGGTEDGK